ncbi:MAG: ABC transporter ATP-binding protein [Myxococcaceae bacterium]
MVIEAVGLTRDFATSTGRLRAVEQVSFKVAAGEVVGLLGANGAGKTTTLRMLAGLLTPLSGTASINGVKVADQPLEARRHLGFLTSSTGLYDRLTGREALEIFGRLQGLDGAALEARVNAIAAELELGDFLERRCGGLSSGQKQRVSIARAVVHDPAAYVLDEPTATLDPIASRDILDLVRRAQARQKAVLFSTHRMEEAEVLCTRLLIMRKGRVVAEGTTAELKARAGKASLTETFLHFTTGAEVAA